MSTLGSRIRDQRKALDLTQDKLAKKVGYSSNRNICNYEKGIRTPDLQTLCKIADALSCTTDYLLCRPGAEAPTHEAASVVQQTGLSAEAVEVLQKLFFAPEKNNLGDSLLADVRLTFLSNLICHMSKSELAESFAEWSQTVLRIKEYEALGDKTKVLERYMEHPEDKYLGSIEKAMRYDIAHEMEVVLDAMRQELGSKKSNRYAQQIEGEAANGKGEE